MRACVCVWKDEIDIDGRLKKKEKIKLLYVKVKVM